jgi:hypothetical protein
VKRFRLALERAVKAPRFSERRLFDETENIRKWSPVSRLNNRLERIFTPAEVQIVNRRLVRAAYLIEPVNEDITSTKYDTRWTARLAADDPRKAAFADCLEIHESLCHELMAGLRSPEFQEELKLVPGWGLSPHEFPVDYLAKDRTPIHCAANLKLLRDPRYGRLLKMRQSLLDSKLNPDYQLFADIFSKVRVKSYLTDRALTGEYKTNREKRWEAHPASPQFALRKECFSVELELIEQLLRFQSFPPGTVRYLQSVGLAGDVSQVARCPVTLDPLDFEVLAQDVMDPTHGKSAYQVGHLNPLKAGDSVEFRHHRANISWITEDGNRIQGHLTLKETRELLLRISRNYETLMKQGVISPP